MFKIGKTLRALAAFFVGLLVAFVLTIAVELFSAVVHPLPQDFAGTTEEMCRHVQNYPAWVLAVVVPAWALIAFISVFSARKIGNLYSAAFVGLLLVAALVCNVSLLPYPIWFKILSLSAVPIATVAGGLLATPRDGCKPEPQPINFA